MKINRKQMKNNILEVSHFDNFSPTVIESDTLFLTIDTTEIPLKDSKPSNRDIQLLNDSTTLFS